MNDVTDVQAVTKMPTPTKLTANAIDKFVGRLFVGHVARVIADFPDNSRNDPHVDFDFEPGDTIGNLFKR